MIPLDSLLGLEFRELIVRFDRSKRLIFATMLLLISRYPYPGRTNPLKPDVLGIGSKASTVCTDGNRAIANSKVKKGLRRIVVTSFFMVLWVKKSELKKKESNAQRKNAF